jgi:hypothetical protein
VTQLLNRYGVRFAIVFVIAIGFALSYGRIQIVNSDNQLKASDSHQSSTEPTTFDLPVWCGQYLYLVATDNSHPDWSTETIYQYDPLTAEITKVLATDTLVKTNMNCQGRRLIYATAEFHQLDMVNSLNLLTKALTAVQSTELSFVKSMVVRTDGSYFIHNGRAIYEYSAKNQFVGIVSAHAQSGMAISKDGSLAFDEEVDEKATQRVAIMANGITRYLPDNSNSASWCGTDNVAFRMNQNEIYLNIGTSNILITDMRFENVGVPNCSPDGYKIVFTATEKGLRGTYLYVSGARGIRSHLYRLEADPGAEYAWDSESRQLAIINDEGKLLITYQ